jgi:Transglutaminase-like superfamily
MLHVRFQSLFLHRKINYQPLTNKSMILSEATIRNKPMITITQTLYLTLCTLILITGCNHQPAQNKPLEQHFYKLIFDDKTVGRFIREQHYNNGIIKNVETLEIKSQFKGMDSVVTRIIETHEEYENGEILGFSKIYDTPLAKKEIFAKVVNKRWLWQQNRGKHNQSGTVDLPDNFLLHQGLKMKMQAAIKNRQSIIYSAWNTKDKVFEKIQLNVKEFDKNKNAWPVEQFYPDSINKKSSVFWVDEQFNWVELNMRYLGKDLHLIRCNPECEKETLEALRPLDYQMLVSPYHITDDALKGKIRYYIQMHSTETPSSTGEQQVSKNKKSWVLDVCADCENKKINKPENLEHYLQETQWMETGDIDLINNVDRSTKADDTSDAKMKALVKATRKRLEHNLQFSGYATASQAFHSRSGDCTEYALLLGTMGRIAKIPTRIVFGLSYSRDYFHGKKHMFAPHAWVQAWVDGGWKSYDAGLEHFDAGHIALKISDGDEQDFADMFEHFSELKIISAQQIINQNRNR